MTARVPDVALCLDVYDRLMAAYHAGPAGGFVSAGDPADAILAKAMEYRAVINRATTAVHRADRIVEPAVGLDHLASDHGL